MYTVCCTAMQDTFSPYSDPQLSGIGLNFSKLLGSGDGSFCEPSSAGGEAGTMYQNTSNLPLTPESCF